MDLAIRVNVRYAAPPNSLIRDALRLFKSPRWVQSIIRYIMPQLNSVSPTALHVLDALRESATIRPCEDDHDHEQNHEQDASICVICMETPARERCAALPCGHWFHLHCIEPWLRMHSTCPTCRAQLPVDPFTNYSVYAINTTIILQESQASMPAPALLELSASNQIIRAVVNARVRRNAPQTTAASASTTRQGLSARVSTAGPLAALRLPLLVPGEHPVLDANVIQQGSLALDMPQCLAEPIVPVLPRNATRRRCREGELLEAAASTNKRQRVVDGRDATEEHQHQFSTSLS